MHLRRAGEHLEGDKAIKAWLPGLVNRTHASGTELLEDLNVGMEMELALDVLYEDDDNEYLIWKWKPIGA